VLPPPPMMVVVVVVVVVVAAAVGGITDGFIGAADQAKILPEPAGQASPDIRK
jgi:hypothetical protein